jgi:hypothetical protein
LRPSKMEYSLKISGLSHFNENHVTGRELSMIQIRQ